MHYLFGPEFARVLLQSRIYYCLGGPPKRNAKHGCSISTYTSALWVLHACFFCVIIVCTIALILLQSPLSIVGAWPDRAPGTQRASIR